MGKKSRTKGHGYEREIARRLRPLFPNAQRNVTETQTGGQGVDLTDTGNLLIQCKRYKNYAPIAKIKEVNGDGIHALVTRGDRERDVVVLYLDDFIELLGDIGLVYDE